jgi:hypothetical protein
VGRGRCAHGPLQPAGVTRVVLTARLGRGVQMAATVGVVLRLQFEVPSPGSSSSARRDDYGSHLAAMKLARTPPVGIVFRTELVVASITTTPVWLPT